MLRSFKPEDFDTLYEIDQACYEAEVAYSKRELRAYLRFNGSDCLVAEAHVESESPGAAEKQIAGFCISARRDESGYIVTIDVLPEFRRHHVGTKLLNEIEIRLATNGVRAVALETATDNDSAVAFWTKHGYRNRGIKKDYYPGGRDAFAMSKTLPR
ncbi:MAG TPA: N-acetyltransferase [Candidatus Acidoferrales bacterium]|nr:N-acetyltransferase [Candidatus Acidoferrales bacterium]